MIDRRALILGMGLAGLSACAPQVRTNPLSRNVVDNLEFSDVTVRTKAATFESPRARDRSSALGPDLRGTLLREFSDRLGNGSATLEVEVQRFNLASSTGTAFGSDQSTLQGTARVVTDDGNVLASFPVQVFAGQASETTTGALFNATVNRAEGYYRSMVDEFADQTRETILT